MTKVYFQSVFNTTKTQKLQQICIKTAKKKKRETNKQTIKQEISILLFHALSMSVLSGGSFLHTSQMLGFFSKLEHKLRLSFGSLSILTVVIYPAIFSVPELAWNPPPNKYPKQRGSYRRNHFSCSYKKS